MTMGRPGKGVDHVDRTDGSPFQIERAKTVLRTVAGELSVQDACEQLGIGPARFQELRRQCLQGAVDALAPGRPGRPPRLADATDVEVHSLREEVAALQDQLARQQVQLDLLKDLAGPDDRAQKGGDALIDEVVKRIVHG